MEKYESDEKWKNLTENFIDEQISPDMCMGSRNIEKKEKSYLSWLAVPRRRYEAQFSFSPAAFALQNKKRRALEIRICKKDFSFRHRYEKQRKK